MGKFLGSIKKEVEFLANGVQEKLVWNFHWFLVFNLGAWNFQGVSQNFAKFPGLKILARVCITIIFIIALWSMKYIAIPWTKPQFTSSQPANLELGLFWKKSLATTPTHIQKIPYPTREAHCISLHYMHQLAICLNPLAGRSECCSPAQANFTYSYLLCFISSYCPATGGAWQNIY